MKKTNSKPTATSIDWEEIHQRIAQAETALSRLDETDPQTLQQIWAHRAQVLAQKPVQEDQAEQVQLILARLGHELYGLDAQYVYDIKPAAQITPVPRVPDWVAGVVNLRGRIFSVVDLRRFFDLAHAKQEDKDTEKTLGENGMLVVAQTPDMEIALRVDDVLSVEALPATQIQEATSTIRGLPPEYVLGVAENKQGNPSQEKNQTLVVLDLPSLLADERLVIYEEIV